MIFVAYDKNTYEVLFVMMCPNEKQISSMFHKLILPKLECKAEDVECTVIDLSANLTNLIK